MMLYSKYSSFSLLKLKESGNGDLEECKTKSSQTPRFPKAFKVVGVVQRWLSLVPEPDSRCAEGESGQLPIHLFWEAKWVSPAMFSLGAHVQTASVGSCTATGIYTRPRIHADREQALARMITCCLCSRSQTRRLHKEIHN